MLVQFSNLLKIRLKRAMFLRNGCAAECLPGASVCVTTAQVSYSMHHKTQSLLLNIFEKKNYGQYPPYWMIHNKVRQQRKRVNCISTAMWCFTEHFLQIVKCPKLNSIALFTSELYKKISVIFLENETTTIVMDVTILPQVYTRHSSPVLELWRHSLLSIC